MSKHSPQPNDSSDMSSSGEGPDGTRSESGQSELAMFPIGSTVFPGQVVPLHIFEERYRTLMSDILTLDGEQTFGIVLIDRGHEVGGGDSRVSVATRVDVIQAEEFDDGRWAVVTVGVERIHIDEWLDDDPYPRALVSTRTVVDDGGSPLADVQSLLLDVLSTVAARNGVQLPDDFGFSADPHQHLDQMSALAPLTEFDRQHVLEAVSTTDQISRLTDALEGKRIIMRGVED